MEKERLILNTKTLEVQTSKGKLLPDFQINAIRKRQSRTTIWFATETGVVRYNIKSGKIETYKSLSKKEKGVSYKMNNVSDIMIDKKGKIWASYPLWIMSL